MPATRTTAPSSSRSSPRSSTPREAAVRSPTCTSGGARGVAVGSIKSVMKMDVLRCKTPQMVEKEIRARLLAYNLLRTDMAVAAAQSDVEPREISFAPKIEAARPKDRARLIGVLLGPATPFRAA